MPLGIIFQSAVCRTRIRGVPIHNIFVNRGSSILDSVGIGTVSASCQRLIPIFIGRLPARIATQSVAGGARRINIINKSWIRGAVG